MALTKDQKIAQVKQIKEKFKDSSLIIFTDYCGLSVSDLTNLRSQLRAVNSDFTVYKNRLAQLALTDLNIPETNEILSGPTGFISTGDDPCATAKVVSKYIKEQESVTVKGGVFESKLVTDKTVAQLASLPSRDELVAKVVGSIKAPISNFVMNLSGPLRGLVYTLKAIQDKK